MAPRQGRLHQPRQHRVYPNPVLGEFQRTVLRQRFHARFGRHVGRSGVHRNMGVQGGDVDDGAAGLLPHHLPCLMLHAQEHPFEAEIDGEVPIGLGEIDNIARTGRPGDVERGIDRPEPIGRGGDSSLHMRLMGNVGCHGMEAGTEFGRHGSKCVGVRIGGDDGRALQMQAPSDGQTDAGRTAHDHRDFPMKPSVHLFCLALTVS